MADLQVARDDSRAPTEPRNVQGSISLGRGIRFSHTRPSHRPRSSHRSRFITLWPPSAVPARAGGAQLFFFSLVRLPPLILVLGVLLYVKRLFGRAGRRPTGPPNKRLERPGVTACSDVMASSAGRSAAGR